MQPLSPSLFSGTEVVEPLLRSIIMDSSRSINERMQEILKKATVSKTWEKCIETVQNGFFDNKPISVRTDLNISKKNILLPMPKRFSERIQSLDFRDFTNSCISIMHNSPSYATLFLTPQSTLFDEAVQKFVHQFSNLNTLIADYEFVHALPDLDGILSVGNCKNLKSLDLSEAGTDFWSDEHLKRLKEILLKNPSLKIILPKQGEFYANSDNAKKAIASLPDDSYVMWPSRQNPGMFALIYKQNNKISEAHLLNETNPLVLRNLLNFVIKIMAKKKL
jgi:hypothetical protein